MTKELTQCCGRPPRLISKPGYGYSVVCMSCGLGMMDELPSSTFQSAAHEWEEKKASWNPSSHGPAKVLLKELNEANDVLRNTACVLSVGGYNASEVQADVFGKKITDGIEMLVKPLETMIQARDERIAELEAENLRLKGRVAEEVLSVTEREDKTRKYEVVVTAVSNGRTYELRRDGFVIVTTGTLQDVRHVHNIGHEAQQALEAAARELKQVQS